MMLTLAAGLFFSCQKEDEFSGIPQAQLRRAGEIPSYTVSEMAEILNDTHSEERFFQKAELLAFALTKWMGDHRNGIGLTGGASLAGALPCGTGYLDDLEILRVLGQAAGVDPAVVEAEMSSYIRTCLKDCTTPGLPMVGMLAQSLVLDGYTYDLKTLHPSSLPQTNQPRFFISYGVGSGAQGLVAHGFEYHLQSGLITKVEKSLPQAEAEGMLLLGQVPTVDSIPGGFSGEWINDPCHYTSSGSGSSGSGSGNSNLDDDGFEKNGFNGPVVFWPGGADCPPQSGVRITAYHLPDRHEGGLFSGKSEIYVNVSAYHSSDPYGTVQVNSGSAKFVRADYYTGVTIFHPLGKQIGDLPPSLISNTTNYVIVPGSLAGNGVATDWSLVGHSFCGASGGSDRLYISLYEKDWSAGDKYLLDDQSPERAYEKSQIAPMNFRSDVFLEYTLSSYWLDLNGGSLYIFQSHTGASGSAQAMPAPDKAWIRVERY